jgi:hypothetical protein
MDKEGICGIVLLTEGAWYLTTASRSPGRNYVNVIVLKGHYTGW